MIDITELGRRIRKLRMERRLTLKQVEMACGLSATHLSEIERGRTSPTIGALVRIARALGKDASFFVEPDERAEVAHQTRESRRAVTLRNGVRADVLTDGIPGSRMFVYQLTLPADSGAELSLPAQDLPGDAFYLVRRGSLSSEFGETRVTLEVGDAVQTALSVDQRLRAAGSEPVELIAVLTRSLEDGWPR